MYAMHLVRKVATVVSRFCSSPTENRAINVVDAYVEYLNALKELHTEVERLARKGWPELRSELHTAFEIQRLYAERALLRLEILGRRNSEVLSGAKKFSEISEMIEDANFVVQDASLSDRGSRYCAVQEEIDRLKTINISSVDEPIAALQKDSEWLKASERFCKKLTEIESRIGRSS